MNDSRPKRGDHVRVENFDHLVHVVEDGRGGGFRFKLMCEEFCFTGGWAEKVDKETEPVSCLRCIGA